METNKEGRIAELRKKLYAVIVVMAVCSVYFSAMFVSTFTGGSIPGPFKAIGMLFTSGATALLAFVIFAVGSLLICYQIYRTWKESLRRDKMDRFTTPEGDQTYGNAHFEEPEEYHTVAQIRPIDKCVGTILGQLTDDGSQCIDFAPTNGRINAHMMCFGASGSGKSFTFVKNKIFQMMKKHHSIIITDPDGGLYRDMAGILMDNGYIVRQLNFSNLAVSDGWHCMKSLHGPNMEINTPTFAHVIITNTTNDPDSIYAQASESLLTALLYRVLLGDDYPEEEKNIKSVFEMLQNPAGLEYLDSIFDPANLPLKAMPCVGSYNSFKLASKSLAGNVIVNLATGLKLLQNSIISDILSTDDIDLCLPGLEPCAYFCQFPDSHDTFKFLVSLFFTMLFITLIDYADNQTDDGRLITPVDFILDEFPSIGVIPDWQSKMSTIRKRAMNVTMICQDITQLQQNYKDSWPTIIANCGTIISLGINEEKTATWFVKRLGEATVETESRKEDGKLDKEMKRMRGGGQKSVGTGKRSLLSVSEIQELGENETIIIFQRHHPIIANMVPHTLHPFAKDLRKILPRDRSTFYLKDSDNNYVEDGNGHKIYNRQERDEIRKAEEAFRKEFWATRSKEPLYEGPPPEDDEVELESSNNPLGLIFSIFFTDIRNICKKAFRAIKGKRSSSRSRKRKEEKPLAQSPAAFVSGAEGACEPQRGGSGSEHVISLAKPSEPSDGAQRPAVALPELLCEDDDPLILDDLEDETSESSGEKNIEPQHDKFDSDDDEFGEDFDDSDGSDEDSAFTRGYRPDPVEEDESACPFDDEEPDNGPASSQASKADSTPEPEPEPEPVVKPAPIIPEPAKSPPKPKKQTSYNVPKIPVTKKSGVVATDAAAEKSEKELSAPVKGQKPSKAKAQYWSQAPSGNADNAYSPPLKKRD